MKISKLLVTVLLNLMKNKFLLVTIALLSAISIGTAADLTSGGLGLSRQSWEAKHGKPDSKCPINSNTCYEGGKYMLWYMNNYINSLDIYPHPLPYTYKMPGINIEESRSLSKRFIPSDSKLIKTYKSRTSGSTVDLYMSESLKFLELFRPAEAKYLWLGGEVGNFIVIHSGTDDVKRILIVTGNNP